MNKKVKLLDCTLRDGGFVNDWNFGHSTFNSIFNRLNASGIDIIEMGFIDGRRPFDYDKTIQPDTASFRKIFNWSEENKALKVAMIDYGTCPIENIEPCEASIFDGIRVIFKKKDSIAALGFCGEIKAKGYKVFIQPVSITTYSDSEMLSLITRVNQIRPYTFSIVDTYGLMHKEKLFRYFYLIDSNLDEETFIGFHSHNNFQLAYSNSVELLSINTERTVVLDGSCYGMGKGAGNANIELLAMFVNENCGREIDLCCILEAIDTNIMPISQKYPWGYSLNYFLAASNDCHPQYVKYLVDKNTLSVEATNEILSSIQKEKKLSFDEEYIQNLYITYQQQNIDDTRMLEDFTGRITNRNILILAPGRTLSTQKDRIDAFVADSEPVIISLNSLSKMPKSDFIFVSNSKRYIQLSDRNREIEKEQSVILTSNIQEGKVKADYTFNYEALLGDGEESTDTSIVMVLKLLEKCGVQEVYVGGLDGFSKDGVSNYADQEMMFEANMKSYQTINAAIEKMLRDFSVKINFVTDTIYKVD